MKTIRQRLFLVMIAFFPVFVQAQEQPPQSDSAGSPQAQQSSTLTVSADLEIVKAILAENKKTDWSIDDRVTVNGGRIVTLDLSNRKFGEDGLSTLPASIGKLTELTQLKANDNDIITLPAEIGLLTKLTILEIQSNSLRAIPDNIGECTALRELDLRSNDLETLPASIGKLKNLEKLKLWSNKLSHIPSEIGSLTSLKELYLKQNRLTDLPVSITKLKIWYLDIMDNKICDCSATIDKWLLKFDDKYKSLQHCLGDKRFK